jgi:hypothetical protein
VEAPVAKAEELTTTAPVLHAVIFPSILVVSVAIVANEVFPVVCRAEVEAFVGKAEELTTTAPVLHAVIFPSILVVSPLIIPKSVIIVSCLADVAPPDTLPSCIDTFKFPLDKADGKITLVSMEAKDVFPVDCRVEVEAFVGKAEELTTTAPVSQAVILEFIDVVSVAIVANEVFPVVCRALVAKPVIAGVEPSCIETFKFPLDKADGKITLLSMEANEVFPVDCRADVEAFVGKAEELTTTAPVSQAVIFPSILVVSVAIVANDVFPVVCKADVEKPVIAGVEPSCIDTFKFPLDKTDGKITLLSMEANEVFPVVCRADVAIPVPLVSSCSIEHFKFPAPVKALGSCVVSICVFSLSLPSFPNSWRETFKFPEPVNDNGKITLVSMEAKLVFPVDCRVDVEALVAKALLETTTAPVLQATTFVSKLVVSPAIVANEVFPVSCLASVANPLPEALTTAVVSNLPLASIESDCHLLDVLEP